MRIIKLLHSILINVDIVAIIFKYLIIINNDIDDTTRVFVSMILGVVF